ncbi:MAG: DUF2934 domain-containing protein [Acidobacteriia bacterium]|nr:DUF2934 domain-containing protein [Terriglobia bacterium]
MRSDKINRMKEPVPPAKNNLSWVTRAMEVMLVSTVDGIASLSTIPQNQRRKLIAEAAYLKAERRGFRGGTPERDWLDAEAEVDAILLHAC